MTTLRIIKEWQNLSKVFQKNSNVILGKERKGLLRSDSEAGLTSLKGIFNSGDGAWAYSGNEWAAFYYIAGYTAYAAD